MGWLAIIGMILQVFGPIIVGWVKSWLEKRMHEAAESMPLAETFGSTKQQQIALLERVIENLPAIAIAKRALVRHMRNMILSNRANVEDLEELRNYVEAVGAEQTDSETQGAD